MNSAAAKDNVHRRNLHHFAIRKNLFDGCSCGIIPHRIVKGGHDHSTVGQVEVDVRHRQSRVVPPFWFGLLNGDDLQIAPASVLLRPEPVKVVPQRFVVLILWIVRRESEDHTGFHEAGDVVHMPVRFVVEQAVAEPDHMVDTKVFLEQQLDLLLTHIRIAVRI